MKRTALLALSLAVFTLPAGAAAQSQSTTGIIRGVVSDPAGTPVAGATVSLRETLTGFQRALTTNERGVFVATLLPLGVYDVSARAVGFNEVKRTGVQVRVGETVDLPMQLAAIELQAVTITATQSVVDATRIESSTRMPEQAVRSLPNNGRNFLNLTLLTPNVAIVQGPDGDELSVAGQRGIHNNVSVDGADFNNPFFGEQRGGQRPAFTFNLDAVQEMVVISNGASAEFGRSSGGFVNVITKSGTNELHGSAHYYGKDGALSGQPSHGSVTLPAPDFSQHQFGFTLGGPIKRDRAFFFLAFDNQIFDETKQTSQNRIDPALRAWMDTAYNGALANDYGPIARSNDARALLAKFDFRLSDRHNLSLKYNHSWSEQTNGTFDVDTWARSSNAIERDKSNAVNGALVSYLSSNLSNEFRFQYSREDRPRPYGGATSPLLGPNPTGSGDRPFPDTGMDFAAGYRFGMPFFIPVDYYDTRLQFVDNVSISRGDHFIKLGAEYNRVNSVQTFVGFANSRYIFSSIAGFLGYVANGNGYVECFNDTTGVFVGTNTGGSCAAGTSIGGPVLLYLQQAGVGRDVRAAGTQEIPQTEWALFIQDSWKPNPKWTFNYGLRWEAQIQPDPITPPSQVFYAPFIGQTRTRINSDSNSVTSTFPSDGTIPSDKGMIQPRFGFTFDPKADGRQVIRGNVGLYYARIPGLNLASSRSTNGSVGQTYFRNSSTWPVPGLGPPPDYGTLLPDNVPQASVFFPDVFVFDRDFKNPRTLSASLGYEWQVAGDLGVSVTLTHARTDNLTRFVNRNDAVFGSPWDSALTGPSDINGITTLTTIESSAKSRYTGFSIGLKRVLDPNLQFQVNYTMSWDKSDDDNERDPFSFRYARADSLGREYNWSDRDQRHRLNGWLLANIGRGVMLNNRVSIYSAQPASERCGSNNRGSGARAGSPADRICPNGSILPRNTLRKDNAYFSWDLGLTWPFSLGDRGRLEAIVQVFNILGNDNFRDPASTSLLFNFDGTIRSGLGDPQQVQAGLHWVF